MTVNTAYLQYYSGYATDQIIGVFTGSISVGAPTSVQGSLSVTQSQAHGFGDSAYFQGIFSTDGGTTWNDFGSQTPYLGGSVPAFQTAECNATVDTTNVNVTGTSWYDYGNSRSVAYTFAYKVFVVAKNSMLSPITPITPPQLIYLGSKYNYQKIAKQGTASLSVASGATGGAAVAYSLGYVPKVRAWWFDSAASTTCAPIAVGNIDDVQIQIDSTNVTFYIDNRSGFSTKSGNVEYRVYYD